jgi:hypothetical protein
MRKSAPPVSTKLAKPVASKKPAPPRDKYFLRDLHQEIDLFDRKLAYMNLYVEFASQADREQAHDKLLAKRASLEKAARELAASGVAFDDKDLPRSFRDGYREHGSAAESLDAMQRP